MRCLQNEKGIALVTALMFTMISLGIIMALMYYLSQSIQLSGSQKKYHSSLEASYGGVEITTMEVIPKLFGTYSSSGYTSLTTTFGRATADGGINLIIPNRNNLIMKINQVSSAWPNTLSKTSNAKEAPDMTFVLNGASAGSAYKVYAKIIDKNGEGNSDKSGIDYLDAGMGVAGTGAGSALPSKPAIYTLEIQGELAQNPREKARLSVLYAY